MLVVHGAVPAITKARPASFFETEMNSRTGTVQRDLTPVFNKYRREHLQKRNRFTGSIFTTSVRSNPLDDSRSRPEARLLAKRDDVSAIELGNIQGSRIHDSRWMRELEIGRSRCEKVADLVMKLDSLQKRRVAHIFDEDEVAARINQEIEAVVREITDNLRSNEVLVKQLGSMVFSDTTSQVMCRNAQRALTSQTQKLTSELKSLRQKHIDALRHRDRIAGASSSLHEDSGGSIVDAAFTDEQLIELECIEDRVEGRSDEISRIAVGIKELNSVFKDLASHVVEQGTLIDRIDSNVTMTVHETGRALHQLHQAAAIDTGSLARKIMFLLVVVIVVNLLVLVIKQL